MYVYVCITPKLIPDTSVFSLNRITPKLSPDTSAFSLNRITPKLIPDTSVLFKIDIVLAFVVAGVFHPG